ncbi:hypothetical protein HYZ99_01455 [Candidatus Peregrinibacteria bacterium]|nr:hypothetical protein [Candidatus Peregrinibacteria bacterium]
MWIAPILILAVLCVTMVWIAMRKRRLKIPMAMRGVLRGQWEHAVSLQDPEKRLMEAEKIMHQAFRLMRLEGSFGEVLKRYGPRIAGEDQLWQAHKLRNRLAHEPGFHPATAQLDRAVAVFERTLQSFL